MIFGIMGLVGCWMLGCSLSSGALARLGAANPQTIGDCFSGDYWLDLWCIFLWPLFWPCWFAYLLARGAVVSK
ncbi:hypothetical protein Mesop_3751 [Mesorhizobium opportunistum WSM2075]|uniref:Uncharacterized protein n=1 Tax=Mesorhizobium opportunistum (strain LMG 24607 / HAMBI 3007 / WSM2075) TaxID=536019 RepID=F7XZX8_MESOW|nr:hypothetical protein Mesop_3751 [Mesorhizobium opportunistum WSM2075]